MKKFFLLIFAAAFCGNGVKGNVVESTPDPSGGNYDYSMYGMGNVTYDKVCYEGMRMSAGGVYTMDIIAGRPCTEEASCYYWSFTENLNGAEVIKEQATCSEHHMTCAQMGPNMGVISTDGCTTVKCDTSACNAFAVPQECTEAPADDVAITPGCTLKEGIDMISSCTEDLVAGFPYDTVDTCKTNLNSVIGCVGTMLSTCLIGACPTVLDSIAIPLRSVYPMIVQYSGNYSTVDAIVATMGLPSGEDQLEFVKAMCLRRDSLFLMSAALFASYIPLNMTEDNPICDSELPSELLQSLLHEVPALIAATNHDEFCTVAQRVKAAIVDGWETKCSKTNAIEFLSQMLMEYDYLAPELTKLINILEADFMNYEIPGCNNDFDIQLGGDEEPVQNIEDDDESGSVGMSPVKLQVLIATALGLWASYVM